MSSLLITPHHGYKIPRQVLSEALKIKLNCLERNEDLLGILNKTWGQL